MRVSKKSILVLILALIFVLTGCTQPSGVSPDAENTGASENTGVQDLSGSGRSAGDRIKVVTTVFPPFDFVRAIGGDKVEVSMLLAPGMESHTYEPVPSDIKKILEADLFIHTGSENDTWVESILPKELNRLEMMDFVTVLMETHDHDHHHEHHHHSHGSHGDHDHDHGDGQDHNEGGNHDHGGEQGHDHSGDHDHGGGHSGEGGESGHGDHSGEQGHNDGGDHDHSGEQGHGDGGDHDHGHAHGEEHSHPDEHVWTSPMNVIRIVNGILEELIRIDPANEAYYTANAEAYKKELENLDKEFRMLLNTSKRKLVVFADRFPFRYLAHEYGIESIAAFSGCSAETEVSAAVLAELIEEVKEHQIPVVFKIEFSNGGIAEAVSESTGAQIAEMHSAHNLTREEIANGETYLSLMRKNLEVLRKALN